MRSSRAGIRNVPQTRQASFCGSAEGVALRLHSTLRSTFTRRPQTEASGHVQPSRETFISVKDRLDSQDAAFHRALRDSTARHSHPTPKTLRAANSTRRRVRHLAQLPHELSQAPTELPTQRGGGKAKHPMATWQAGPHHLRATALCRKAYGEWKSQFEPRETRNPARLLAATPKGKPPGAASPSPSSSQAHQPRLTSGNSWHSPATPLPPTVN